MTKKTYVMRGKKVGADSPPGFSVLSERGHEINCYLQPLSSVHM